MYRSILVGTDGSDTARQAVRRAASLARATGARLHLVTAFRTLSAASTLVALDPSGLAAAASAAGIEEDAAIGRRMHDMLRDEASRAVGDGVALELHAVPGDPAEVLLQEAERRQADLIVVGSRGMAGARRFLGSVPNKVSHHARCDVLIVHTC